MRIKIKKLLGFNERVKKMCSKTYYIIANYAVIILYREWRKKFEVPYDSSAIVYKTTRIGFSAGIAVSFDFPNTQ